jgi:MerR family transcriptional regulator, thiopeptide resistance regulator
MTDDHDDGRRIGELAAATGMTVRTLHHYEDVGLLEPASRSEAGHRRYGPDAVERLYRIAVLRSLGLSLAQVRSSLEHDAADLGPLLNDHLGAVEAQLSNHRRLHQRLTRLVDRLAFDEDPTPDLLDVLEEMTMTQPTVDRRLSILVYEDIEAAYEHLTTVFALGPGELTRDDAGLVVHGELRAGDGDIWLHRETAEFGLASPRNLGGATATMAVMVDDVDAHHRHAVDHGAEVRYGPVDQPYGYREYSAVDPEGHLWSFMRSL